MQRLALRVVYAIGVSTLLGIIGWVYRRFVAGVLLLGIAMAVTVVAAGNLIAVGMPDIDAFVAGFALAQPAIFGIQMLHPRFDARAYWRPRRLPAVALDLGLAVCTGAGLGFLTLAGLSWLALAGDRLGFPISAVGLGAQATFMLRTQAFRANTDSSSLAVRSS